MTLRQLRIYTVREETREAFYSRWDTQARPLMQQHGFRLVEEWEGQPDPVRTTSATRVVGLALALRRRGRARAVRPVFEFGYVLEWEHAGQMRRGWDAFLADEQWQRAKAASRSSRAGEPVALVTDRLIEPRRWMPSDLD